MSAKRPSVGQPDDSDGPQWREASIPLDSIVKHGPLQVRTRLDPKAVRRYRDRTKAGQEPPPIKVGKVAGVHYLVDGWHRMEAGAHVTHGDFDSDATLVHVLIADMTEAEVRWESAAANMDHGVPLKNAEYRQVCKAFIRARKHRKGRGEFMSYREIGAALGKGHTTIRGWIRKDFPRLAKRMGSGEQGNGSPNQPDGSILPMAEEHRQEGLKAANAVRQGLALMTPQGRWEVAREFEAVLAEATRLGLQQPDGIDDEPDF